MSGHRSDSLARRLYEDPEGTIWEHDEGKMWPLNRSGKRLTASRSGVPTMTQLIADQGQIVSVSETRILEKRVEAIETALYDQNIL